MGNGSRKYTPIWKQIKEKGYCEVACPRPDTITVMNGVKKEKYEDKSKPAKKQLICTPTDKGVLFRLVDEVSINNL